MILTDLTVKMGKVKLDIAIGLPESVPEAIREYGEANVLDFITYTLRTRAQMSARNMITTGHPHTNIIERMKSWRPDRRFPKTPTKKEPFDWSKF